MSGEVLECVVCKLSEGVVREDFLEASDAVSAWVRAQPGFVSRELFETEAGRWIDILRWTTLEDAMAAGERIMESESCTRMMAMLDETSVQMLHGRPTAAPVKA